MKFYGMQGVLLLAACLLIVHEAATRRKACPYRQDCMTRVRLSAAAVCRHFADTESSCRSCHCQAPSSLYCRRLCAFREQIAKCAREFLCPPTTAATTVASTEASTLLTSSTAITTTTPMACGTFGGICLAECVGGSIDESGLSECSDAQSCCILIG